MSDGDSPNILESLLHDQSGAGLPQPVRDGLSKLIDVIYPTENLNVNRTVDPTFPGIRRALDEFGSWNRGLNEAVRRHLAQQGQIEWSESRTARCQRRHLGVWLDANSPQIQDRLSGIRDTTDLGTGDGRMMSALADNLLSKGSLLDRTTLIDQDPDALELAKSRIQRQFADRLTVQTVCGQFQNMKFPDLDARSTLALASGALHELTASQKSEFFRVMATRAQFLILIELVSDHDVPHRSVDLMWRAAKFYDALMSDAFASLRREIQRTTIGAFLLDELLDLWLNNYENRHNYHLSELGWFRLLENSGFRTLTFDKCACGSLTTLFVLAETYLLPAQKLRMKAIAANGHVGRTD